MIRGASVLARVPAGTAWALATVTESGTWSNYSASDLVSMASESLLTRLKEPRQTRSRVVVPSRGFVSSGLRK